MDGVSLVHPVQLGWPSGPPPSYVLGATGRGPIGLLPIPASVQETWVGEPVRTVVGFEMLGEPRLRSAELLVAAGLLGGS